MESQVAAGIYSCPTEILLSIFQSLSPADLRALCLINKDFQNFVEPLLYSRILWNWKKATSAITLLLRTILRRPQLATYITTVCFGGHTFRCWDSMGQVPPIPIPSELVEPITFIRGTETPYSDLWIQELCLGTMDAWLALLLAQLPNLRSLYLGPNFTKQCQLVSMVLGSAICEPVQRLPDFQHLRDVLFLADYFKRDKGSRSKAEVLPLFYLPSVQGMSASIENPVVWPTARPPVSNITSLDLTIIRETYLGEILSVTPNLEALRWEWYFDYSVKDQITMPIVNLDQIDAALSHVQGTLTNLTISAECLIRDNDQLYPPFKIEGSLSTLTDFNKLKELEIPLVFLVGFARDPTKRLQTIIPRNIEYLLLTDDLRRQRADWPVWEWNDYAIIDLVRSLLEDWRVCTPYLRGLAVQIDWLDKHLRGWPLEEWLPEMIRQFRRLGPQLGVPVEIFYLTE